MKKHIFILCLILSIGCKSNTDHAETICKQLTSKRLPLATIDSLVLLAQKMSDSEYTSVHLAGAKQIFLFHNDTVTLKIADSYIKKAQLRTPISMKIDVSLAHLNWITCNIQETMKEKRSELVPITSQLIYQLDKKNMSAQQQIDYLLLKNKIYSLFYKLDKALEVASKAENIAKKNKLPYQEIQAIDGKRFTLAMLGDTQNERIALLKLINFDCSETKKTSCYYRLYHIENQDGNYLKALTWFQLFLKSKQRKDINKGYDLLRLAELYTKIDSFPQALETLKTIRQCTLTPFLSAILDYQTARIHLALRDTAQYENYLTSYIHRIEIDSTKKINTTSSIPIISEYAQLLWDKKQYKQAIEAMEKILPKIKSYPSKDSHIQIHNLAPLENQIAALKQLWNYYGETKHYQDAFSLRKSYDTLHNILYKNAKTNEYIQISQKFQNQELYTQLNLLLEQLHARTRLLRITIILLIGVFVCLILLYLSYQQRKKQLNALYLKQKEIEHLQKITVPKVIEEIPADKQLFDDIERCIQEEELFRQIDFSRDELCKRMNTNRMYISSCINKYAEMNFNQWINKARVQYAIKLINAGEYRLNVISLASGFASSTSFFRSFKQFTSLSPNQYIEREKQGAANSKHNKNSQDF